MDTNGHESDKEDNIPESVSLKVAGDAVPVCPNCFEPCDRLDYYCKKCGSDSPVNPTASYMPLESVRFQAGFYGNLWRKIWASDTSGIDRCINIMLLMLFCPIILLVGLPVIVFEKLKTKQSALPQQDPDD